MRAASLLVGLGLAAAWGCGSRTAALDDAPGNDGGTRSSADSGGGSGSGSGGSGGSSGSSSGSVAPDSGACAPGASLCAATCCTGTCTSGRCLVTLASGSWQGGDLAVDATTVYWLSAEASGGAGVLRSVPIGGGTSADLAPTAPSAYSLAADGAFLYWIDGLNITRVARGGGVPVVLAAAQAPWALAVDATTVYWTDQCSPPGEPYDGMVMSVPSGGGQPTTLAVGPGVYEPSGIAVDATSVYWVNYQSSGVQSTPLRGGPVVTISSGLSPGWAIAALPLPVSPGQVAQNVYWTAGDVTDVGAPPALPLSSAPVAGGPAVTLASDAVQDLAVDATTVYWSSATAVMSAPLSGGTPTTLALSTGGGAIAVDATSVYWIDHTAAGSAVMKLTPK